MIDDKTEHLEKLAEIVRGLYDHIIVGGAADATHRGFLHSNKPFGLDKEGYYRCYRELMRATFGAPSISEKWSEAGITERIRVLLVDLATLRDQHLTGAQEPVNFREIAESWWSKVDVVFPRVAAYVPIRGLALADPLELGDVRLLPLKAASEEMRAKGITDTLGELPSTAYCVAAAEIEAEPVRAAELLQERADQRLNVLRYISALVWPGGPVTPIYVSGREPAGNAYTLTGGVASSRCRISNTTQLQLPFVLNSENLQFSQFYGLGHLQAMVGAEARTELEEDLLTAIHWFGNACQDISPSFGFVKSYVALETAVKKDTENARRVLPDRVSALLANGNRPRRERLKKSLDELIQGRNEVFHQGKPSNESIEYLQWMAHRFARNTIHEVRQLIEREHLQSKDELTTWISSITGSYD